MIINIVLLHLSALGPRLHREKIDTFAHMNQLVDGSASYK